MQDFFSIKQVADRYGVHTCTVRRWIQRGTFPRPLRLGAVGTVVRFRGEDIAAHEAARLDPARVGAAK